MIYNLFVEPAKALGPARAEHQHDRRSPRLELVHEPGRHEAPHDRRIVRGPNVGAPPDPSHWVLTREKTSGAHPGFTARDAKGETFFLEFDPPYYPEGATAAVAIATKIFWALGYNQVESFLTTFDPKNVSIRSEGDHQAALRRADAVHAGRHERDPRTRRQRPDGTYRVIAGRLIPGKILGNFRYHGHAHRRSERSRSARASP